MNFQKRIYDHPHESTKQPYQLLNVPTLMFKDGMIVASSAPASWVKQ
jgi:hypothetical protein